MGNSVPILRRQSCIMLCNRVIYHLLVFESRKTDVKPIFVSLEQCQNLTLILETTKIGESRLAVTTWTQTQSQKDQILYMVTSGLGNAGDAPAKEHRRNSKKCRQIAQQNRGPRGISDPLARPPVRVVTWRLAAAAHKNEREIVIMGHKSSTYESIVRGDIAVGEPP